MRLGTKKQELTLIGFKLRRSPLGLSRMLRSAIVFETLSLLKIRVSDFLVDVAFFRGAIGTGDKFVSTKTHEILHVHGTRNRGTGTQPLN